PSLDAKADNLDAQTICPSGTVSLTANPSGGTNCGTWKYAWYTGDGTGSTYYNGTTWTNAENYNTSWSTIASVSPASTTTYKAKVRCTTTTSCTSTDATGVTVTVGTAPAISSQPSNTTACEGTNTNFSVTASGAGLTYQWQVDTGSGFSDITTAGSNPSYSGYNSATLTLGSISTGNDGYAYRCVVSGSCGSDVTSNSASLTINENASISLHPSNVTICEGLNTNFSCTASGTGLTYQWQVNTGSGYNNINAAGTNPSYAGYTSATLNLNGVISGNNGYLYRCVISGTCSNTTSNAASLTVNTSPIISGHPSNSSVCPGDNTSFTSTAAGTGISYQWEVNTGSGWSSISTAGSDPVYSNYSTATLGLNNVISGNDGNLYHCVVTGTCGTATSNSATLSLNNPPVVTTHPTSEACYSGQNVSFTVAGTGTGLTYQWQQDAGSGFANLSNGGIYSGVSTNTLTLTGVTPAMDQYKYRCIISGTCSPSATSNSGTLTVGTASGSFIAGNYMRVESGYMYVVGGLLGDITIDGTLINNGYIILEGDWDNNNVYTADANSTVEFRGNNIQNISSNNHDFGKVLINNAIAPSAADGIVLQDDMEISTELKLTDGSVITDGNTLLISSTSGNAVIEGSGNTNYVNSFVYGTITRNIATNTDIYDFPVGSATTAYLAELKNNSMTGSISPISATFELGAPANAQLGITDLSDGGTSYVALNTGGTWDISTNGNNQPSGGSYDLKLYFSDFTGLADNKFGIVTRSDHSVAWSLLGTYQLTTVASGYAYRTAMPSFSKKGIAMSFNPLPVELVSYQIECEKNRKKIHWNTASENNNDYFMLDKSYDGYYFENIALIPAIGNSNKITYYEYYDAEPKKDAYYKLSQTDYDGTFTELGIVKANCSNLNLNDFSIENIYYTNNNLNVVLNTNIEGMYNYEIIDAIGRKIHNKEIAIPNAANSFNIPTQKLAQGVYLFVLQNEKNTVTYRFKY
ncbi:MAG: hypothetical protein C0594_16725, partial [Marinilabiliales bacterium]